MLQMKGSDGALPDSHAADDRLERTNAGLGFSSYSMPSTYNEHHYRGQRRLRDVAAEHALGAAVRRRRWTSCGRSARRAAIRARRSCPGSARRRRCRPIDVATSLRLTTQVSREHRQRGGDDVHAQPLGHGRGGHARRGGGRDDGGGSAVPEAAGDHGARADGVVPAVRVGPNDNHFETRTMSWGDNVSWVHGKQRLRGGGFFLDQYNGRADTGGARGKITFQTFEDFLVGLSAADNLSPTGRSNIQSVQANEGVGPNGEVEYRYRRYYGAAFVQDDIKVSARFTLNLGLRWEYIGPSLDEAGTIGNVSLALLRETAIPPAGRNAGREHGGGELRPGAGQSLHREGVRTAAGGRGGAVVEELL